MTSPRTAFVASQVTALEPLDFVLVGTPEPPFDAVQVLREEDATLAVVVSVRAPETPFTPEQLAVLTRLGFPEPKPDEAASASGLRATAADADAAAGLVDAVLGEVFALDAETPVDVRHGSEREARAAVRKVEEMHAVIAPVLEALLGNPAPQDADGDYLLDLGHVRVFVAPRVLPGRPPPIIRVFAITNAGVNMTPELGLFLARLNFNLMFGRFSIDVENSAIWFDETLLGDHVTEDELRFTVEMVATTANEWDQKIAGMFGGRTRSQEPGAAGGAAAPSGPGEAPKHKPGQGGYL